MVIKSKYDFRIALASYTICFPLSILFYLLIFHLVSTDIPDYGEASVSVIFLGLLIPIYPSIKLFAVIKRRIVNIYEKVKEGSFRFNEPKKALIVLCSTVVCSPLSVVFYVLFYHLVPEDISVYKELDALAVVIGMAIPIYPIVKLYDILKRNIVISLEEVNEGTLRLEFHNPPLAEQYPEIYSDEGNKTVSYEKDESDNSVSNELEIIENEIESSGELTLLMKDAISTQSAWGHYKSTKHSRRKAENLAELQNVLNGFLEVAKTAVDISHKDVELQKNNINKKRIIEIENLKNDVEIAKLQAEKYKHEESISKSKQEIANINNSPPPATPKSRQEIEAERQKNTEAEADRRDRIKKGWVKELSEDPIFRDEDIPTEIERRMRARGWLERI